MRLGFGCGRAPLLLGLLEGHAFDPRAGEDEREERPRRDIARVQPA
jgi:hypothetical protein